MFDPSARQIDLGAGVGLPSHLVRFEFTRSSGPGGQHVNKTATRAVLRVRLADLEPYLGGKVTARLRQLAGSRVNDADELVLGAEASRSQLANRTACVVRLRELVDRARQPRRARTPTRPTRGSQRRRIDEKKKRGAVKARRQSRKRLDEGAD